MNGTFYPNPTFPGAGMPPETTNYTQNIKSIPEPGKDYLPMEQSYIENILRLNKGSKVSAYASFPDSNEWRDKIFTGTIEQAGRDHLIISNETNWYLIPLIYINYVEFDEKIIYRPVELKQN